MNGPGPFSEATSGSVRYIETSCGADLVGYLEEAGTGSVHELG